MKFILANDAHISHRNPSSRIDDYHAAIFDKLEQLFKLAVKVKAGAILLAGDQFNEKNPQRVPIRLVLELYMWCKQCKQAGIRVIAIPGNHDLMNDRYDSLPNQPMGLLFASGAMEDASFRIVPVGDVDVIGIPYPAAKHLELYDRLPSTPGRRSILMCHCFATLEGGEYFGEPILKYSDLCHLPYNVFHVGHDHSDHGVSFLSDRWFINLGALSRGALSQDNIGRDVKCALVEMLPDETKVLQVRLNFRPASDVFDLALRAQRERERTDIEQFVGQLEQDLMEVGPINFKEKIISMELPDKIRSRVLSYIETAEAT